MAYYTVWRWSTERGLVDEGFTEGVGFVDVGLDVGLDGTYYVGLESLVIVVVVCLDC